MMDYKKFYSLVSQLRQLKKKILKQYPMFSKDDLNKLEELDKKIIGFTGTESYEHKENEKDLVFLKKGLGGWSEYCSGMYPGFEQEIESVKAAARPARTLISDRDGTLVNYCSRYRSSIQAIYNAYFLQEFTRHKRVVILTSGQLSGLKDVMIMGGAVLAGSKGREVKGRKIHKMELDEENKKSLKSAYAKIKKIVQSTPFEYIGSGLQEKYGEITVARQDIEKSIPDEKSLDLIKKAEAIAKKHKLHLNDTGLDIELSVLKDKGKEFTKSDGIQFISECLGEDFSNAIVCGDTASDLAMLEHAKHAVFVTNSNDLKKETKSMFPGTVFVSTPDALVTGLYMS